MKSHDSFSASPVGTSKAIHTIRTRRRSTSTHLLDVVVGKSSAVLQLLTGEDQTLLVGGDTLLVLDLLLDAFDGVRGLHVERDRLASQSLHENLRATKTTGSKRARLQSVISSNTPSTCCESFACLDQVSNKKYNITRVELSMCGLGGIERYLTAFR